MDLFSEYDVVRVRRTLSANVAAGAKGVVLMIFDDIPVHYEVEFLDNKGNHLGIFTVSEQDLDPLPEDTA